MNHTSLIRQTDLIKASQNAYKTLRRQNITPTPWLIALEVSKMPAPAYYITYTYALSIMRALHAGRQIAVTGPRRKMLLEFYAKLTAHRRQYPSPISDATAYILASCCASSFFLSPQRILTLLALGDVASRRARAIAKTQALTTPQHPLP